MAMESKPLDAKDLHSRLTPDEEEQLVMRWSERHTKFLDKMTVLDARQLRHNLDLEIARIGRVQSHLVSFRQQVEQATGGAAK